MSAQNQVTLIGRLTRDPDIDEVGKEKKYLKARLSLAIRKRNFKSANGQVDADFIYGITAWRKQAEFAQKYLTKGRMIVVHGELTADRWQDKDGRNRYQLNVMANSVQALDSKKSE